MLPVAGINNPVPVPIVNTTLPGTVITHVPYDNVAPSISSAQVNNNASPNNSGAAAEEQPDAAQTAAAYETQTTAIAANNATQNQSSNAQATFLAQLLSQDGSPPVQTILMQYEKLSALSNVKYKPSDAFKPVAAPASTFGRLLQENRPLPAVQPAPQPPPRLPAAPAPTIEEEAVLSGMAPNAAPPPRPLPRTITSYGNTAAKPAAPQIISAYTSTATRVDTQSADITTELA